MAGRHVQVVLRARSEVMHQKSDCNQKTENRREQEEKASPTELDERFFRVTIAVSRAVHREAVAHDMQELIRL